MNTPLHSEEPYFNSPILYFNQLQYDIGYLCSATVLLTWLISLTKSHTVNLDQTPERRLTVQRNGEEHNAKCTAMLDIIFIRLHTLSCAQYSHAYSGNLVVLHVVDSII